MNLPNTITLGRIFLVPLLVVVLLTRLDGWYPFGVSADVFAAGIFGLASVTDWLDGYLARRRKQVTDIGQWMDPLADKLLVTAALISLASRDFAPPWMVAVILGRELSITVLRSLAHSRGVTVPASPLGKVKMVAQVVAILALILASTKSSWLFWVGTVALWIAMVAALVSAIAYYRQFSRLVLPAATPRVSVPPVGVPPTAALPASPSPSPRAGTDDPAGPRRISA